MRKMRILLIMVLGIMLIAAITACGPKRDFDEEVDEPENETEAVTEEEYDIAANLKETVSGDAKTIETDHFTLTLSLPDTWNYEKDSSTSITFFNIAGREADCGGRLLTLMAYEPEDTSYEQLPHYSVVGDSGNKVYIAEYPSDVQADVEVEEHMKQYETVYAEVSKIESKAADSPLVLK